MCVSKYMMRGAAIAVGLIIIGWGLSTLLSPPDNNVRLVFTAVVGEQPLIFNKFEYRNPAGDERFKVRDFKFFLSNIRLTGVEGEYVEPDSYHLVRFDGANATYSVDLKSVRLSNLEKISLSIGVDRAANSSIAFRGDLDPNSQMAWNWEVGYKFVLLEGGLRVNDQTYPLVYHVGFSENRQDVEFVAPRELELGDQSTIRMTVDLMKIFDGATVLDLVETQKVVFDKAAARIVADNYRHMISVNW